jgi:hypothetical protein
LLFETGQRPDRHAIATLAGNSAFGISLDPADNGNGDTKDGAGNGGGGNGAAGDWLELIANGLTFDLVGLRPGAGATAPPGGQAFGLPVGFEPALLEAITLRPGPHLAEGATMLPVVRSMAWLSARLADLPATRAVSWHPARCWCSPRYFRDSVLRWMEGGVFPGLGLATLAPMPDGGMQSQGLALFTGQELRLEPELAKDRAAGAKIALRLMHWLVENGRVEAEERVPGPDGQILRLEPSANRRFVRVWRG